MRTHKAGPGSARSARSDAVRGGRPDRPGARPRGGRSGTASGCTSARYRRAAPVDGDAGARASCDGVLDLAVEPGAPWAVRDGRRSGPASARRACAARRSAATVDLPGSSTSRPGRAPLDGVVVVRRRGRLADGRAVTWNLVDGLHDGVDDVRAGGLGGRRAARGGAAARSTGCDGVGELRFTAVATRARARTCCWWRPTTSSRSATFTGALPVGGELRERLGRDGAPSGPLVTRRSSSSSIFECIAPIRSRSGSRPARTISAARSGSTSPSRSTRIATSFSTSGCNASR